MKAIVTHASSRLILLPLLMALICIGAFAQANSNLTGIITDQSGAVIPGATIQLSDSATGAEFATISSDTGLYEIAGLNPSSYNLKVTANGFQTYVQTGIVVNVSATVRVDARLVVGSISQTVTVEANPLTVQADSNAVSSLISEQQITELATNGRNIVALAALGLGVSANLPDMNMPTSVGANFAISFNGLNQAHNIWLIDGGEAYDRGSGGKSSIMPSQDALGEFQVLASNYPPDYGISSGGTVSMALKAGSQKFHGELWEFDRNDALQAHNYFDNNNGQHRAKPELRLNIFGFNVGGPAY
ncbi:MAG: carboxypeptidase-like regulatory domain-containing protein, partial [Terracidiphilus sp.]